MSAGRARPGIPPRYDHERMIDRLHETERNTTNAVAVIISGYLEQNPINPADLPGLVMTLRVAFTADLSATQQQVAASLGVKTA